MRASVIALALLPCGAAEEYRKVPLDVLPERARHGALAKSGRFEDRASENSASQSFTLTVPLSYNEPDGESFDIRYFVDSSSWDSSSGPIFLSMGGEGGSGGAYCSSDCRQHRAMAVAVEHRFYGKSLPGKAGVDAETYRKGLLVEWNLRDTAAVVDKVQASFVKGPARTVVNFGGSYSGGTCAWFRQLFPNKTAGCVSSSGVVDAKLDFPEFDEQISEAYAKPDGEACPDALRAVMDAMERKFAAGQGDAVKKLFDADNLVGTPQGDNDFWYGVADGAAMIDQYGGKAELCQAFQSLPAQPSDDERISNFKATLDHHYGQGFVGGGFYDSECVKSPTPPSHCASGVLGGVNDRSWRFQKCSELGYLQSAPLHETAMRSTNLTIQALLNQCDYVFGEGQSAMLRKRNAAFQKKFGGSDPTSGELGASNILYLDFSDDPWQRASVNKARPDLPYCMTTCDGCGHCGSGVPSSLTECTDKQSHFITQLLSGAQPVLV